MSKHMVRANAVKAEISARAEHVFAHQRKRDGLFIHPISIVQHRFR